MRVCLHAYLRVGLHDRGNILRLPVRVQTCPLMTVTPALVLAHNGWIWDGNPLADFAGSNSRAYLQRKVRECYVSSSLIADNGCGSQSSRVFAREEGVFLMVH